MWKKILDFVTHPVAVMILLVLFFVGLSYVAHYEIGRHKPPVAVESQNLHYGLHYKIKTVKVLQAHVFDVVLENDKRYLIALDGVPGTPPEAKEFVVRYLNDCREKGHKPAIVPHAWDEAKQYYLVDLFFEDGQSLTQWLYAQKLAYSR
jgi:hypothetical protein